MNNDNLEIDVEKIVQYWINSSDEDYESMMILFKARSFVWSLFIGHIVIEKLLKAYYVKKHKKIAPYTHNLYRLAELNEMKLKNEYTNWLDKITTFNLNTRYDDYKREFYFLCTEDFTKEWIKKICELREWIKKKL